MTKELQEAIELFVENPYLHENYDVSFEGDNARIFYPSSSGNVLSFLLPAGDSIEEFINSVGSYIKTDDVSKFVDDAVKNRMQIGENHQTPVLKAYRNASCIEKAINALYDSVKDIESKNFTRKALLEKISEIDEAKLIENDGSYCIRIQGPHKLESNSFNTISHYDIVLDEHNFENKSEFHKIMEDIEYAKHYYEANYELQTYFEAGNRREGVNTIAKDSFALYSAIFDLKKSANEFMRDYKENPQKLKYHANPRRIYQAHQEILEQKRDIKTAVGFKEKAKIAAEIQRLEKKKRDLKAEISPKRRAEVERDRP